MTIYNVTPPGSKTPRFAGKVVFGVGHQGAAGVVGAALIIAIKSTAGTAVPGLVYDLVSEDQCDQLGGEGCMGATMGRAMLKVPGVRAKAIFVAEAGAGTAATASLVLGGVWSTAGDGPKLTIAGYAFQTAVSASMTIDLVGAAIAADVNKRGFLPVTAAYDSATTKVTFTCKWKGAEGRAIYVHIDKAGLPVGMTAVLNGLGAADVLRAHLGEGSSGTGTIDLTNALATLNGNERFSRVIPGVHDPTNAALVEAYVDAKSTADRKLYEHAIFGSNDDYATAQTLAKSTLNAYRCSVVWARNSEVPWWEFAAEIGAARATYESSQPNWDSDAYVLQCQAGRMGQRYLGDSPNMLETDLSLDNGVTPLETFNSELRIVRGINSYSVGGTGLADYRCLDWAHSATPDFIALDFGQLYVEFREQNTLVGPDPAPEDSAGAPEGVATPAMWKGVMDFAANDPVNGYFARALITSWFSDAQFNPDADAIEALFEVEPRPLQHKLSVIVRQTAG